MDVLTQAGIVAVDGVVYLTNGALSLVYWLFEALAPLISIAVALLIAAFLDADVQHRAGHRPRRTRREAGGQADQVPESVTAPPRTAQALTLIVLGMWLIAQGGMGAPVPAIGAAMWIAGVLALLVMPAQRFPLLWGVKAGLAIYALAVAGSRLYLHYTARLTPEQWAALIGSTEDARVIVASTRGNVTTIILWALWAILPLGYFSLLIQQVFVNPMAIISPFAAAQDVLERLRTRG